MRMHVEALYSFDGNQSITGINQFNGGDTPRFHLARAQDGNFCVFRHDVPEEAVAAIRHLVEKEPPLASSDTDPLYQAEYLEILAAHGPVESVWRGPAFGFPDTGERQESHAVGVVSIDHSNRDVLGPNMKDWLPDVGHRDPFMALIAEGCAVAVCASVRMTPQGHEAGVETVPDFRGRGYATRVVSAWADAVRRMNVTPIYSTSWDNTASRAVAKSLKLEFAGSDFHVR